MQKKSRFSNFNLAMLNLWIGLCRGDVGLPQDIRRLGYKQFWIEYEFQNSAGESVKPELIIASDRVSHTVLLEWKEGPNTDSNQLDRYSKVTSKELLAQVMLHPSFVASHDICVVGLKDHVDRLAIGLRQGAHPFPLISIDDDALALYENQFAVHALTLVFSHKLYIDFSQIPTSLIPFDQNSEPSEIAEIIIPQIVAYMSRGEVRFTLDQLVKDSAKLVASIMAPAYFHDMSGRVRRIVNEASRNEFRAYIAAVEKSKRKSNSPTWEINYNPLTLPFDKRSPEAKKLQRLCAEFIEALRTGKRQPDQLTLDDAPRA